MLADHPAYAASVTVFGLHRTFQILPVVSDCTEITPFHAFPAAITCCRINSGNVLTLPHQLAKLHFHLEPVCHAIPVTVAESGNKRGIECPDTVSLTFGIELPYEGFGLFCAHPVKVTEIRDVAEYRRQVHTDAETIPLILSCRGFPAYAGKPHQGGKIIQKMFYVFKRHNLTEMRLLQASRDERINKEMINTGETLPPCICTLNVNGQGMVKLCKIPLQVIFRVYLMEHLLGIVCHVFVPFFPFAVLNAEFTHRFSGNTFYILIYFILNSPKERGFDMSRDILCILRALLWNEKGSHHEIFSHT
jgi:hypothetical protein